MTANLGIFAINLDRSPERWTAVQERFGRLPWPLYRVSALDGINALADVLAFRGQKLVSSQGVGWSFPRLRMVSTTEEACFCSHMLALQSFLETRHEFALILEDDARPFEDVATLVENVSTKIRGQQIAKLSGVLRPGHRLAFEFARLGKYRLVRSFRPASNAAAYMVTRDSADRLVKAAGGLLAAYDDYLSAPGLHGCEMLHLSPWPITNKNRNLSSTIETVRAGSRNATKRLPYHYAVQALRRASLRIKLWRDAFRSPNPFRLTFAKWSPDRIIS